MSAPRRESVINRGGGTVTQNTLGRIAVILLAGTVPVSSATKSTETLAANQIAEAYVKLVLAMGQHDPDYVDAYYGPAEWKTQAEEQKKSLEAIGAEAAKLSVTLIETPIPPGPPDSDLRRLRREYLHKQISALAARAGMLKD